MACWQHSHFVDSIGNSSLAIGNLTGGPDFFGRHQFGRPRESHPSTAMYLSASFVTVNVQSLCEDERSALPNRVPYVRAQLDQCGCAVAGLQETRTVATSTVLSDTHIRFTSARDANGCFGVELWFSRKHSCCGAATVRSLSRSMIFAFSIGLHVCLSSDTSRAHFEFCLLCAMHRQLPILIGKSGGSILLICFPSPSRVTGLSFLGISTLDSRSLSKDELVTSCGRRTIHLLTPSFACYSLGICGCRPHTQNVMQGPGHTWVAPGGMSTSRIDYILLPTDWWVPPGASSVLYHVDFGQAGLDHFAASVEVHQRCSERPHFSRPAQRV